MKYSPLETIRMIIGIPLLLALTPIMFIISISWQAIKGSWELVENGLPE